MSEAHSIVIGGGIVGISTGYHLARRGHRVTVIEKDAVDTGASMGNAGIIALGHPPMPRPGLIGQTLKMLFDETNPLYISPRLDLELLRWMWQFRKACSETPFRRSMDILAALGRLAGDDFDQLVEEESLRCEYHRSGWMEIYRTEARMEHGRHEADMVRKYGFRIDMLSGDELREREPAFLPEVVGAAHYTDSRFANPGQVMVELADRAAKHGARLLSHTAVAGIDVHDGRATGVTLGDGQRLEADTIVLASGAWTTELGRRIGVRVPMQPGKGYHLSLDRLEPAPSTTCVLAETFVAVTPLAGGLRLGGTVEFSGLNLRMRERRLEMLRVGARKYIRGIDGLKTHSTWCGLRPCTADGLPVIGPAPQVGGVYVGTGHAMMGFALGPVTGRLISECILDGRPSFDLTPLLPDRFARG